MIRTVPGWEGYYEADRDGNIYSKSRVYYDSRGRRFPKKGRILKPSTDKDGYLVVIFTLPGVRKTYKVHRVVCMAFGIAKEGQLQINHKNGIKNDNRLENLELCSGSYNVKHSLDRGLRVPAKGSGVGGSILVEADIFPIMNSIIEGETYSATAKKYGVTSSAISQIAAGNNWNHITRWSPSIRPPKRKTGPKPSVL